MADATRLASTLFVFSMLVIGALAITPLFHPTQAFAATITSSNALFFGPALERFLITDSSKINACDTITVHVKAARGLTSLAENDVTLGYSPCAAV